MSCTQSNDAVFRLVLKLKSLRFVAVQACSHYLQASFFTSKHQSQTNMSDIALTCVFNCFRFSASKKHARRKAEEEEEVQ